ncbi:SRPBCC family protein [Thiomonas sp. X19]|uniref:SRPBCC family protein n=1 Tax=Thiomonas sp. X19 TaxID=1050370 RepID=UPI001314E4EB|nr:SRPBCC family protein [Thiomonas sp. X19]
MSLSCTAQATLPCSAEAAFDLSADPVRFPPLFRGYGLIPSIRSITLLSPLALGCERRVANSDGSVLTERVTALQRPHLHAYTLSGFRPPFSWLVRQGVASWTFAHTTDATGAARGCAVEWRYTFTPRAALSQPFVALLLRCCMQPAMQRSLDAMARACAASLATTPV